MPENVEEPQAEELDPNGPNKFVPTPHVVFPGQRPPGHDHD